MLDFVQLANRKELHTVPSNRSGQFKIAAVRIADLLSLNLEKTALPNPAGKL